MQESGKKIMEEARKRNQRKLLSDDYDINVDNMVAMTPEQEVGNYKVKDSQFFSNTSEELKSMKILTSEDDNSQIFQMTDGKFILEVFEGFDDEGLEKYNYYYSDKISDLL